MVMQRTMFEEASNVQWKSPTSWIGCLDFSWRGCKWRCIAMYLPNGWLDPDGIRSQGILDQLEKLFKEGCALRRYVILGGDMNVHREQNRAHIRGSWGRAKKQKKQAACKVPRRR